MNNQDGTNRLRGMQQFRSARRKARLNRLMSRLTGRPDELLIFDEVRKALALAHPVKEDLRDIPLNRIVGTVNRYHDFNRQFNPIQDSDEDRWARVKEMMEVQGLDPIEVYQVDDIYFVLDGNHRVSVSRQFGSETIHAYVKEFRTEVDLEPEDDIEAVVLKAEWRELMADTQLSTVRPAVDIRVTVPGRYDEIREHIAVHRYYMGQERGEEIPMEEASASWVDNVYLPAVEAIRELKLLEDFPGRTETDLYLWLKRHQHELQVDWKREVGLVDVAADMTDRFGESFCRRLWGKLFKRGNREEAG